KNNSFYIFYNNKDISSDNNQKDFSFLNKELIMYEEEIKRIEKKLENKNFIDKAPKKIVDENKYKLDKFYKGKKKVLLEINSLSRKDRL
ncbi:MAG: hypothetical protein CFH34_00885, partial [Alphaproteobacteria bacterium MarineAlpha9_Bin4]